MEKGPADKRFKIIRYRIPSQLKRIILTTSKYHSRRAGFIWEKTFANQLLVRTISAKTDPYDPDGWWKEGRQIRWVLAEYGAWIYHYWKRIKDL